MKNANGIRIEKGMRVEIPSNLMSNPVVTDGGKSVCEAFFRIYGIDIKKVGALNMTYLEVERIR